MALTCPLCGNNKQNDSLFCDVCSKKLNSDFEIDLDVQKKVNTNAYIDDKHIEDIIEPAKTAITDQSEKTDVELFREDKVFSESEFSKEEPNLKRNKKTGRTILWVFVIVIILTGLFIIYNKNIRVNSLELRAWESALNENSVSGYLSFIEAYPNGKHFEDAQAGLMKLKEDEAVTWERLKMSDNLDELLSFSRQYESSPYMPLVNKRIDSLSWISALKINNAESYSEYVIKSETGVLKGDYLYEASKRQQMLLQSTPVDNGELNNIRNLVSGFYKSLSEMDNTGVAKYLAPEVSRFYDSGGTTREKISGELILKASLMGDSRYIFEPDIENIQYHREPNSSYKVNIPLAKSYTENGSPVHMSGYIAHLELNMNFEITSIYETKPFPKTL